MPLVPKAPPTDKSKDKSKTDIKQTKPEPKG